MSNATLDYFEEYRGKIAELHRLSQQLEIIKQDHHKKLSDITTISDEIYGMKQIISVMIDNGWDPVEAKLRIEGESRQNTLWQTIGVDSRVMRTQNGLITTTCQAAKSPSGSSTVCSYGAIGATGASGAVNHPAYGYASGANGCIGYNGTK
jgi:hypothetical protein